jgi:rod shape-determining protein MreD
MRWAVYIVVLAVLLTAQSALAPVAEIGGIRPDWLLAGAVFLGLYVKPREAVVSAWAMGLCADLLTVERPGLVSLSYLLTAAAVGATREYVFRYWILTQFSLTLAAALCGQTAWMMYRRAAFPPSPPLLSDWFHAAVLTSLYTAVWAPLLCRLLLMLSNAFGIVRPKYGHAGLRSLGTSNV